MLKKRTYIIFGLLIGVNVFTFMYIIQAETKTARIQEHEKLTLDETFSRVGRVATKNTEPPILSKQLYPGNPHNPTNEGNHFNEKGSIPETVDTEIVETVNSELPILPTEFAQATNETATESLRLSQDNRIQLLEPNENCSIFPNLEELQMHNDYWQIYRNKNISFQLYGAYLDKRRSVVQVEQGVMVRILAMINQNEAAFPSSYCQLWFEDRTEPVIVPVSQYLSIWPKKWGSYANNSYPHLMGCILPADMTRSIPQSVALVDKACSKASNMLEVQFEAPTRLNATKEGFAVCLKGLNFPDVDISGRLIEWLEMMRLVGAAKIYVYDLAVHPNITKVLNYYEASKFVEVTPITLADGVLETERPPVKSAKVKTFRKRMNELVPYNDCFYRHMYQYDYIALIDIDELIMPLGNLTTWRDIVAAAAGTRKSSCKATASICFRNTFFPSYDRRDVAAPALPSDFHMLAHVYRLPVHNRIGSATKCLHNTQHVISLHNHYPRKWLQSCGPQTVNTSVAQLQHYRDVKQPAKFEEAVFDDSISRYSELLVNRSMAVLAQLGLV